MAEVSWVSAPEPFEQFKMPGFTNLDGPGVYRWQRSGGSYVGMASNLRARLGDHRRAGLRLDLINGEIFPTDSVRAAARLEAAAIWLLAPTENDRCPTPTLPLWTATIGFQRPIEDWTWFPHCGHVMIDRRVLGYERGCRHKQWNWAAWLRDYAEYLELQLAELGAPAWPSDVERYGST